MVCETCEKLYKFVCDNGKSQASNCLVIKGGNAEQIEGFINGILSDIMCESEDFPYHFILTAHPDTEEYEIDIEEKVLMGSLKAHKGLDGSESVIADSLEDGWEDEEKEDEEDEEEEEEEEEENMNCDFNCSNPPSGNRIYVGNHFFCRQECLEKAKSHPHWAFLFKSKEEDPR